MAANPSSPWLSERMLARLSPLRIANLQRRMHTALEEAALGSHVNGDYICHSRAERITRSTEARLGRLAALR